MKLRWLVVGILVSAGVAGCAANKPAPPVAPTIVARDAAVATILACIEEHRDLSRQDQRTAYAELEPQAASGTEADRLRLACLGLHERAMVRQLRRSIELVEAETEARSSGSSGNGSPAGCSSARKAKDGKAWPRRRRN
jgi:hypothetical protein